MDSINKGLELFEKQQSIQNEQRAAQQALASSTTNAAALLGKSSELIQQSANSFQAAVRNLENTVNNFTGGGPATGFARGGSIFKPRGTDTVPAMLTPGEFVVRKSAVDQYGTGMMEAMNSGNAQVFAAAGGRIGKGVLYRQGGGSIYSPYGTSRSNLPSSPENIVKGTGVFDPAITVMA